MIITAFALSATALSNTAAMPRSVPTSPAAVSPRADMRYCVKIERTGSRMARKECRTRAEWLDRGFDPLAKD